MILIDLGNTNAKIFHEQNKIEKIASDDIISYLAKIREHQILICSVVPRLSELIAENYPQVEFINSSNYHLMFDNYEQLQTKGADRIIASYGAVQSYGPQVVVCDIGTCVTLDIINGREYCGGLIYPGFAILEQILHEKIEQLPKAEYGQDSIATNHQIYWANLYGFIGALQNMIAQSMPSTDYKLIITGGSVLKLKAEYDVDVLQALEVFNPQYDSLLIKKGLELYIEKKL